MTRFMGVITRIDGDVRVAEYPCTTAFRAAVLLLEELVAEGFQGNNGRQVAHTLCNGGTIVHAGSSYRVVEQFELLRKDGHCDTCRCPVVDDG